MSRTSQYYRILGLRGVLIWASIMRVFPVWDCGKLTHLCPPLRSTFAVRETASLGIMGTPRVPPFNPSETIVLSEHYRLRGV